MSLMTSSRLAPLAVVPPVVNVPHGFLPEFVLKGALQSADTLGLSEQDTKLYREDLQRALEDAQTLRQVRQNGRGFRRAAPKKGASEDLGSYEPGRDAKKTESFIYTANNGMSLPGTILWRDWEDAATAKDKDVPFLAGKMQTHVRFLKEKFGAESIDNNFYDLHFTMHYGRRYNNAFWNSRQMVTGDGDGTAFGPFHMDEDVIFHEIDHGYTEYNAGSKFKSENPLLQRLYREDGSEYVVGPDGLIYGGLDYYGESGALNESYSDIFAVSSRVFGNGKKIKDMTDEDWCLGAICMIGNNRDGTKSAIRHFSKRPGYDNRLGKDPQPKHMRDFYRGGGDNGGVHYNSGITNHTFYLAANKLAALNPEEAINDRLSLVWEKAEKRLHNSSSFKEWATHLVATARDAYPENPEVSRAIEEALTEVGIVNQGFLTELWYKLRSTTIWLPDFLQNKMAEIVLGGGAATDSH